MEAWSEVVTDDNTPHPHVTGTTARAVTAPDVASEGYFEEKAMWR